MKASTYIFALAFVAAACSDDATSTPWQFQEEPEVEDPEQEEENANEAWAGIWRIDQPAHALYEATWYDFRPDGTLIELETQYLGSDNSMEIGFVSRCNRYSNPSNSAATCLEWSPTCTFGDSWEAPDETTLLIAGECSDGQHRLIELYFGSHTSYPDEIIVENETWEHNGFIWQWTPCDAFENCQL